MKTKLKKCLRGLEIFFILVFALWGAYTLCAIYAIITMPGLGDPSW